MSQFDPSYQSRPNQPIATTPLDARIIAASRNFNLKKSPEEFKQDRQVVLSAVQQKDAGMQLEYAADHLKNDREIVMAAISDNGLAIQFASDMLKHDINCAERAVRESGDALEFLPEWQDNRYIVGLAVHGMNRLSLKFASQALRDDFDIVLKAVSLNGFQIQYASDALQENHEIVLRALLSHFNVINVVPQHVLTEDFVVEIFCRGFNVSEWLNSPDTTWPAMVEKVKMDVLKFFQKPENYEFDNWECMQYAKYRQQYKTSLALHDDLKGAARPNLLPKNPGVKTKRI